MIHGCRKLYAASHNYSFLYRFVFYCIIFVALKRIVFSAIEQNEQNQPVLLLELILPVLFIETFSWYVQPEREYFQSGVLIRAEFH